MELLNRTPQALDRRCPDCAVVDRAALMFLQPLDFPGDHVDLPLKFGGLAFGLPLATDDVFKLYIQIRFPFPGGFLRRVLAGFAEQGWKFHRA